MKQKIKTILLLVLFAAFAIWLYPTVVGYWATLYIPLASKLPRTRMIMGTWLSAGGASGAAICAFLLAWPLGYLVPFVEEAEFYFLKTVIPSRKATRDYLQGS